MTQIKYDLDQIATYVGQVGQDADGVDNDVLKPLPGQIQALEQAATAINNCATALDTHCNQLRTHTGNTIPAHWMGKGSDAAQNAINGWLGTSGQLQTQLADLKQPLQNVTEQLNNLNKGIQQQKDALTGMRSAVQQAAQQAGLTDQQSAAAFR